MSEATAATAAETTKPVLPYDPEPEHVTKTRDVLKAANVALNKKLAALDHMREVFDEDSPEVAKAMEKVLAAQAVANMAIIDKDIAVAEHGIAHHQRKHDEAHAAIQKAMASGDLESVEVHMKTRAASKKALHGTAEDPELGLIPRHAARIKRYADPAIHEHVSDSAKKAIQAHGLSR